MSWWCPHGGNYAQHGHFSSPLQFPSSPVQEQGLLCQAPEKRQVCKWCGGSLEAHGEARVVSAEGVPVSTHKHAEFILGGLMADASLAKL